MLANPVELNSSRALEDYITDNNTRLHVIEGGVKAPAFRFFAFNSHKFIILCSFFHIRNNCRLNSDIKNLQDHYHFVENYM